MLPGKVRARLTVLLFHVPPAATETSPVKVLAPVAEVKFKIPLAPAPTVVEPATVKANPPAVRP